MKRLLSVTWSALAAIAINAHVFSAYADENLGYYENLSSLAFIRLGWLIELVDEKEQLANEFAFESFAYWVYSRKGSNLSKLKPSHTVDQMIRRSYMNALKAFPPLKTRLRDPTGWLDSRTAEYQVADLEMTKDQYKDYVAEFVSFVEGGERDESEQPKN